MPYNFTSCRSISNSEIFPAFISSSVYDYCLPDTDTLPQEVKTQKIVGKEAGCSKSLQLSTFIES